MAKTVYGDGVIVTTAWLNGARSIVFDGQDLDWHFNPLGLESIVSRGPNGLDNRYVTLGTNQPSLTAGGELTVGVPISGDKVVVGRWSFGFNPTINPAINQSFENAPKSYLTNLKYVDANGTLSPSYLQRLAALDDPDLITKQVLYDQLDNLVIDNGEY